MISSEMAEAVFEVLQYGLIVDSNARVVYLGDRYARDLGVQKDQVLGKHVKDVIPFTKMDITLKTKKTDVMDLFNIKDKTVVITRKPIFNKEGQLMGALAFTVFDDILIAKKLLEKIDHLNKELSFFKKEVRELRGAKYSINNIVGTSEKILKLRDQITSVARSKSTVLIEGETGTGKELVAHSIHDLSERKYYNFIRVNSTSIPENLIESELFGYEEGAFTGAKKGGKLGKFELANKGTLFIDEIGSLPLSFQPKLLRVLQEGEIDKVGGSHCTSLDVRIIVATNTELSELVKQNLFREDLYYRLNVLQIKLPPLREIIDDLPVIAERIMQSLNQQLGLNINTISMEAYKLLRNYHWPGNIRELHNVIERAMNQSMGSVLDYSALEWFKELTEKGIVLASHSESSEKSLSAIKNKTEAEAIIWAIKECSGNKSRAAKMLKISRPVLYKKIKYLDIHM